MVEQGKKRGGYRPNAGRPPIAAEAAQQIAIRLPIEMLQAIEAIAAERMDKPDRSNLIREMLADGIKRARRAGGGVS